MSWVFVKWGIEAKRFRYPRAMGTKLPSSICFACPTPPAERWAPGLSITSRIARQPTRNRRNGHGEMARLGYNVSPVINRYYFHSIYFREPGGCALRDRDRPAGIHNRSDAGPTRDGSSCFPRGWSRTAPRTDKNASNVASAGVAPARRAPRSQVIARSRP